MRERSGGRTVVLVTHEPGPMEPLFTRTIELGQGRIVRETTAALGAAATGTPA